MTMPSHESKSGVVPDEQSCVECAFCSGNGIDPFDGSPCFDCEGTGCERHPFCDADHDGVTE